MCRFFLPPPELVSAVGKLVELLVGELQHPIEIIGLHIAFKRDAFAFFQRTGHHLVQLFQGIPLSGFAFPRAIPFLYLSGNGLALLCLLTGLPAAFFSAFFFAAFLFQRLFCGLQIIRRLVLDCFPQVLHQFLLRRNLFFLLLPFLCCLLLCLFQLPNGALLLLQLFLCQRQRCIGQSRLTLFPFCGFHCQFLCQLFQLGMAALISRL